MRATPGAFVTVGAQNVGVVMTTTLFETEAIIEPGSDAWLRLVTASKVAAILDLSSWDSPRSMWHKMRGDFTQPEATKVQRRGHYLEPAVLAWFFDQHPELRRSAHPGTVVHGNGWAAATPDAIATSIDSFDIYAVEAKTAADDSEWGEPGTDEVPTAYAAQCMWTMHVLGVDRIYVPMLTQRLEFREYVIDFDPTLALAIETACKKFIDSLDGDEPPAVDFHPETYKALCRVNPEIEDVAVQLTEDQARLFASATVQSKAAEKELALAKSTIAEVMGTAKRALYGESLIARRQNTASGVPTVYAARTFPTFKESSAA